MRRKIDTLLEEQVRPGLAAHGGNVEVIDVDNNSKDIKEAIKKFGRVDILVNNAGATANKDRVAIFDLDENEWDRVIDVNLKGVYLFSKAFSKQLISQSEGGKIINISSIAG